MCGTSEKIAYSKKRKKAVQKLFNQYGEHLANAITILSQTIDPSIIVLGGSVAKSFNLFKKAMFAELKDNAVDVKLLVEINMNIALLGAYALIDNQ